jgi:uncharacterized membrane protein
MSKFASIGITLIALLVTEAAVALPFTSTFVTGELAIRYFDGTRTPLVAWIAMYGWFLLIIGGWAWLLSGESRSSPPTGKAARLAVGALRLVRWSGLVYTVVSGGVVAYRGQGDVGAIGVQFAMVAWLIELFWRNAHRPAEAFGLFAAFLGFGLDLCVEFVVLGQDLGRMNTYFKVHLQVWILLAVAAGIASGGLAGMSARYRGRLYGALIAVTSLLALCYLPLASYGRNQTRFQSSAPLTLDGEAFMGYASYDYNGQHLQLADDQKLIAWLRGNTRNGDVILEAQLPEYRWGSRLSVFTGRPTVLGYRHHESQQRPVPELGKAIELRKHNIEAMYKSLDRLATLRVLRHYGVRYIIVGGLERASYPPDGLKKFREMVTAGEAEIAFSSGDDLIYRVADPAATPAAYGAHW